MIKVNLIKELIDNLDFDSIIRTDKGKHIMYIYDAKTNNIVFTINNIEK